MAQVTVAHLSDLHLSDPPWGGRVLTSPKRALAFLAWRLKKRRRHDREILDAAVHDLHELNPDAVVITGDMTQLGTPTEYEEARQWLAGLATCAPVSLVPGNHDLTRADPHSQTLERWSDWMPAADSGVAFPTLQTVGDLALIGLSSAVPTGVFLATGTLGRRQLERLDDVLERCGRDGRFRVVFLHHPPREGIVGWRKRLTDARALGSVLERHGVELLLHGHAHRPLENWATIAGRPTPVLGAASTSEARSGSAQYNLYTLTHEAGDWAIEQQVREYSADAGGFGAGSSRPLRPPGHP